MRAARNRKLAFSVLAACVLAYGWPSEAGAACVIESSPCYPWRIEDGAADAALLEIIPNNAVTGAIYRVCACGPAKGVTVTFDFGDDSVRLGELMVSKDGATCRDFRIQTSRKSRLLVRRLPDSSGAIEGCYTSP